MYFEVGRWKLYVAGLRSDFEDQRGWWAVWRSKKDSEQEVVCAIKELQIYKAL